MSEIDISDSCESKQGEIFSAIPKIMADLPAVGKDQVNVQQKFKYRGIDDIYNAVQRSMAKMGVFTVPKILSRSRNQFVSKSGGQGIHAYYEFRFRFYAKDGSYVDAFSDGEAIDYGDKVANKCASIAHKYALLQVFCIPTEDLEDPDQESHEANLNQPKQQDKPIQPSQPAQQIPMNYNNNFDKPFGGPPIEKQSELSQAQIKRLYAKCMNAGWDSKALYEYLMGKYRIPNSGFLNRKQYDEVCNYFDSLNKNNPAEQR